MSDKLLPSWAPLTAATTFRVFQGVTWLLTVPGASRTVLEARVPYAQSALQDALKFPTASYATVGTAVDMAKAAYKQAAQLSQTGSSIIGIGCTCALMTDRVKKGDHKVHSIHLANMCAAGILINLTELCKPHYSSRATLSSLYPLASCAQLFGASLQKTSSISIFPAGMNGA